MRKGRKERFIIESSEDLTRDHVLEFKIWILNTESDIFLVCVERRYLSISCSKKTIARLFRDKENEFAWMRKIERDDGPKPVFLDMWSSSEEED